MAETAWSAACRIRVHQRQIGYPPTRLFKARPTVCAMREVASYCAAYMARQYISSLDLGKVRRWARTPSRRDSADVGNGAPAPARQKAYGDLLPPQVAAPRPLALARLSTFSAGLLDRIRQLHRVAATRVAAHGQRARAWRDGARHLTRAPHSFALCRRPAPAAVCGAHFRAAARSRGLARAQCVHAGPHL